MAWTHLEEALLMELYHLTRDAGNINGITWQQVATSMNLHIKQRKLDLKPRFTGANVCMNYRNHKEALERKWGSDWKKAATEAGNTVLDAAALREDVRRIETSERIRKRSLKAEVEYIRTRGGDTASLDILAAVCVSELAAEDLEGSST